MTALPGSTAPTAPTPPKAKPAPSLRTELLVSIAMIALAALVFAVGTVLIASSLLADAYSSTPLLTLLIAGDVLVMVTFSGFQLRRLIIRPLDAAVSTAEAVAAGDLNRRVPLGDTEEFRRLAISFNQMTDRLIAEQELLVRSEKLASVGRFAAGVAHEVGNPLAAINAYAHILRDHAGNNASATQAVQEIRREVDRIDRIIRGLLDYSRPRKATPYAVAVDDVVGSVVEMLKAQGVLKRIDVKLDLITPPPRIFGNRHDLEQILVNLLLNASDAMEGDGRIVIYAEQLKSDVLERGIPRRTDVRMQPILRGPSPRARIWLDRAHRPAEVVKIVVADSGPGVPPELYEKIFDPYFTTKDPARGTGLGLAIVARIVDDLGGTIWVSKAREGGAAFHLLFPLLAGTDGGVAGMPAVTLGSRGVPTPSGR